ncbi:MAG: HD domain-containing protein, partial [Acutalibacteraceae bacterium]
LSLFGKSELTFWMARLQNQRRKMECVRLLKSYHKKEIQKYNNIDFNNFAEKRDAAFLIRGINVSLIYENDREALEYYLNSLLTDKIANSVNRGFHLEYYGDKPYIPNKTLLDFEDDVTKGENTLTILCISLDRRIRRNDVSSYVAALEVMTVCNLIQARIEQTHNKNVFDVKPYIGRCLRYLNWIIGQRSIRGMTNVVMYFMWMHKELNNLMRETNEGPDNRIQYSHAAPFNKFSTANSVERTGWVKSGVPKPENIVEHMYNCWLIGMLYLPDEYHDPEYSKDSILKMLLIHDLGETETGDINRPEKQKNRHDYDYQESMVMQSLLLSGTYPGAVDLSSYIDYWKDWNAKQSINYYVAKDIDNIQTIFQFCNYYNQYPDIFTIEDIIYWLSGIDRIETDLGKDIAEKLITYNPVYADILKLMNEQE